MRRTHQPKACRRFKLANFGLTLAEIMIAMGILAVWSVSIIFTSQKALQNSLQVEEVQESYEQAEGLMERAVSLSTTPGNWRLFDETSDGDKDGLARTDTSGVTHSTTLGPEARPIWRSMTRRQKFVP